MCSTSLSSRAESWFYVNMHFPIQRFVCRQTNAVFDTICKGCEAQCKGCAIEGEEPICLEKLDHSSATGGNGTIESLSIDSGYWRATNTSINILSCYNEKACMGGVTGGDNYCLKGYKGPCQC